MLGWCCWSIFVFSVKKASYREYLFLLDTVHVFLGSYDISRCFALKSSGLQAKRSKRNMGPMACAVISSQWEIVEKLAKEGFSVDPRKESMRKPLGCWMVGLLVQGKHGSPRPYPTIDPLWSSYRCLFANKTGYTKSAHLLFDRAKNNKPLRPLQTFFRFS